MKSPPSLAPSLAWVTGASSGIGRALALRLVREGWRVAASARNAAALAELAAEAGERLLPAPVDVSDRAQVQELVSRIEVIHGPIDLAVLNAGTHLPTPIESFSAEDVGRLVAVNLMGVVHGLEALLARMTARGQGHIAVVSSVAGYRGLPTAAGYGATKAALINLCESLRFDCQRLGIKLQLVSPGFVETPLTDRNPFPMPFLMPVDRAVDRLVRGLAGNGFEITFPRRFTFLLKLLRCLPYRLYFPLVQRATGK